MSRIAATPSARSSAITIALAAIAAPHTTMPTEAHTTRYPATNAADQSCVRTRPFAPRRCNRIIGVADGSIIAAIITVHVPRNGPIGWYVSPGGECIHGLARPLVRRTYGGTHTD